MGSENILSHGVSHKTYLSDERWEVAMVHYLWQNFIDKALLVFDVEGTTGIRPGDGILIL